MTVSETYKLEQEVKLLKEDAKKWKILETFFETSDLNKIYHYKEIVQDVRKLNNNSKYNQNDLSILIDKILGDES